MFNLLDEIRKNNWNFLKNSSSNINETNQTYKPNGHQTSAKINGTGIAHKKTVTTTSNLVKKRIVNEKKSTSSSSASSPTSTITIESTTESGNGLTTPSVKSASQLKAEAARQRLMEAKKNAFKQKKEAEERLLKQQQELNGGVESDNLIATSDDNQFFSISS